MAEPSTARVNLRHHTVAEEAAVSTSDGRSGATEFVALSAPLPVGTVLTVGERRMFVVSVVESGGDEAAGDHVREATEAEIERHERLGTEELSASNLNPSALEEESDMTADAGPAPDVVGMGHAVPAPVTEPDPSGPLPGAGQEAETTEETAPEPAVEAQPAPESQPQHEGEQPAEEAEATAGTESEADAEPAAEEESEADSSETESDSKSRQRGGKRRKGRRRS